MGIIEKFESEVKVVKDEVLSQLLNDEFPNDELNKIHLHKFDGFKICLVNGEFVRNNLETDFTMGSHHLVSEFIPNHEIWVDVRNSKNDIFSLIHHELTEAKLMKEGMSYEDAHAIATQKEEEFRKQNFCEHEN